MELNYFKDILFDLINKGMPGVLEIISNDKEDGHGGRKCFLPSMRQGTVQSLPPAGMRNHLGGEASFAFPFGEGGTAAGGDGRGRFFTSPAPKGRAYSGVGVLTIGMGLLHCNRPMVFRSRK